MDRHGLKRLAVALVAAGGFLHALKGLLLLTTGGDLSFVPAMVTLFGSGLIGLALLLPASIPQRIGLGASALAVGAGCVSLVYQSTGIAPEDFGSPTGVQIAYATGTFGIFAGLLALGIAVFRNPTLEQPWRTVPLVVGIIWFPLEGLTEVVPDGWGLLFAGLSWLAVAPCIYRLRTGGS